MPMRNTDPLLAELQGEGTTVTALDPLEQDARDPLEVPAPAPTPAIAKMDEKFSTRAGGKGYAVTVKGEYYAHSKENPAKKIKKPYEVVVNLPSLDSAMSVIKHKLLDNAIKRKYQDSVGARTHEIVAALPLSPETPESNHLQFMPRPKLETYVVEHRVPVTPTEYADVVDLRSAVIDYTLNPKGFPEREAVRQADRKESAELAKLNPELA